MTFRFREHRGHVDDSLDTMVQLDDNVALLEHLRWLLRPYGFHVSCVMTMIYLDKPDPRTRWPKTYLVKVPGYGVIGYTDQMPPLR